MNKPQLVEFQTEDGLTLPGILYEQTTTKRVAIYLHGNGTSSVFYNQNEKRILADMLYKNGISLLYFNNRGANLIKALKIKQNDEEERKMYGTAYELIKECVYDIDGAIAFLKKQGYEEFYLIGSSTGANKICVYDHYKPKNEIKAYILADAGDDTGFYYYEFGRTKFWKFLEKAKEKIKKGKDEQIMKEILPEEVFSYKAFYDIANPDGDYNCFPYYEIINDIKLSKKPLLRYYKAITKPSLVVYGELDEYAWGDVPRVVSILKKAKPEFEYVIIPEANHGMSGKQKELGEIISKWLKENF